MTAPTVTYTWRIERMDRAPIQGELINAVCRIHWRLFGADGTNTTDLYGDICLAPADPEDFVAYPELDEATVVTWLETAIDAAEEEQPTVAQMRACLAATLTALRTPTVVSMEPPWG